jgi:CheY-like chemotaxis protein/Tfp pilus assembly protein PilZ
MPDEEPKHILVIEDSRALREAIQALLTAEGFQVTATDGGPSALALLDRQGAEFDLIILEPLVPATPASDVLEWLRAARPGLTTPVLALTAPTMKALTAERLRGMEAAGVQDVRTLWEELPYRVRALLHPQDASRRAAVRIPAALAVNVWVGPTCLPGIIGNLSRVGMFVKLEAPPKAGQPVLFQFLLPHVPALFEVRGRVVWAARREHGAAVPGMGAEFLGLDGASAVHLDAFLGTELAKFRGGPGA